VKDEKNMAMKFAVACGGASLTRAEPLLNISRVTLGALATVLGGGQSIFTEAYDEAYSIPTEHSAKIALRIQQILASPPRYTRSSRLPPEVLSSSKN
jgi:methylmalonyl-CoA mutase (EC 5.4.99.2)